MAPEFAVEELDVLEPVAVPVAEPFAVSVPVVVAVAVDPDAPVEVVAVAAGVFVDAYCEARAQY